MVIDYLIDRRSEPEARAVLEDIQLSAGERITRLGVAIGITGITDDDADEEDDAACIDDVGEDPDDGVDAQDVEVGFGDDDAGVDVNEGDLAAGGWYLANYLNGDADMRDGLKIIKIPGGLYGRSLTRVGWLRRVSGDEYELIGARSIWRTGGALVPLDALASDGLTSQHRITAAAKMPEEIHRLLIRRCIPADEAVWASLCPKPAGWSDAEQ